VSGNRRGVGQEFKAHLLQQFWGERCSVGQGTHSGTGWANLDIRIGIWIKRADRQRQAKQPAEILVRWRVRIERTEVGGSDRLSRRSQRGNAVLILGAATATAGQQQRHRSERNGQQRQSAPARKDGSAAHCGCMVLVVDVHEGFAVGSVASGPMLGWPVRQSSANFAPAGAGLARARDEP
jgi:hypothetical protein